MWPNLSLTAKGLILVSIPLIFEVGFVFLLTHFLQQAEMEADRAVEARDISDKVSKLTATIYTIYNNVTDSAQSAYGVHHQLDLGYKKTFDEVAVQYDQLDQATKNKPELNPLVHKSAQEVAEARQILDQAVKDIQAGNLDYVVAYHDQKSKRLGKLLDGVLSTSLQLISTHQRISADNSNRIQAEIRAKVMQLTFIGLAANVIFSILLALFFVKTVVTRLNVMTDNAVRLAADQPLRLPLSGQDEIAVLDRAFHRMADSIIESSRMKEELVGMLTHDLRSPLTFIQGSLEMMNQGLLGQLNERGRKLVKMADRNAFFMMGLINDLLDSQKIQSNMMTIESVDVCVAELFENVRLTVADWVEEHGIAIKIQDSDLFVRGDQEKLSRVLLNLVSNAVKYSKEGDAITLGANQVQGQVEITVSDQGPGIPKDMLRAVFDRFQQVSTDSQAKQGSGLGLSICQQLVTLHGGKIWVTSERGKGSIFHFTLPAA